MVFVFIVDFIKKLLETVRLAETIIVVIDKSCQMMDHASIVNLTLDLVTMGKSVFQIFAQTGKSYYLMELVNTVDLFQGHKEMERAVDLTSVKKDKNYLKMVYALCVQSTPGQVKMEADVYLICVMNSRS